MNPYITPSATESLTSQADRIANRFNALPPGGRPAFAVNVTGIGEALAEALIDRGLTVIRVGRVACWENPPETR
jgi:hypothetical protein